MSSSDATTRGERLDGWKQIASYLGRGVRTVQRWEARLGMPVHRMATGNGDALHAFTGELDEWRLRLERARSDDAAAASASMVDAPGPGEPAGEDDGFRRRTRLTLLVFCAAVALVLLVGG